MFVRKQLVLDEWLMLFSQRMGQKINLPVSKIIRLELCLFVIEMAKTLCKDYTPIIDIHHFLLFLSNPTKQQNKKTKTKKRSESNGKHVERVIEDILFEGRTAIIKLQSNSYLEQPIKIDVIHDINISKENIDKSIEQE